MTVRARNDNRIMKTEKDIRKFIQDNRIPVPQDDAFMADLVRQIDLLPTPASLSGTDEERILENMRILALIRDMLRKRYRRQAARTLIMDILMCAILFAVAYMLLPLLPPDSAAVSFIFEWKNFILGFISLGVLAVSFSHNIAY